MCKGLAKSLSSGLQSFGSFLLCVLWKGGEPWDFVMASYKSNDFLRIIAKQSLCQQCLNKKEWVIFSFLLWHSMTPFGTCLEQTFEGQVCLWLLDPLPGRVSHFLVHIFQSPSECPTYTCPPHKPRSLTKYLLSFPPITILISRGHWKAIWTNSQGCVICSQIPHHSIDIRTF